MPHMIQRALGAIAGVAIALTIAGCSGKQQDQTNAANSGKIEVVTTISTINSFVIGVGGDRVHVVNIVPVGASPETFQPTPQDVATVSRAQLLVENGSGLESWLGRLLSNAASPNLKTVVCADGLPVKNNNPHLWMDPQFAKQYVLQIRDGLIALDPQRRRRLQEQRRAIQRAARSTRSAHPREDRYGSAVAALHDRLSQRLAILQRSLRHHDARASSNAIPGQEPNPQQIAQLIDLAKQHACTPSSASRNTARSSLNAIAQGAGIRVVENLYDDSIGTDPRVANYIAMLELRHRTIIVEGAAMIRRLPLTCAAGEAAVTRDLVVRYDRLRRADRRHGNGAFRRSPRHRRPERFGKIDAA